jgi:leader peptidase (prepilin peptidase)/N-methyltransferase
MRTAWTGVVPVVMLAAAVIGAASWTSGRSPAVAVAIAALTGVLVLLAVIDVRTRRLPNPLIGVVAIGVAALAVIEAAATGTVEPVAAAGGGAVVSGTLLAVPHLISPAALGFGDVKLGAVTGALVGWSAADLGIGWAAGLAAFAVVAALLWGAVLGLAWLVVTRDRTFPFGPCIVVGAVTAVIAAGILQGSFVVSPPS